MNKLQSLVLILISALATKAVVSSLSLSEALVVLGLVSYQAFLTYIEWKKAKEIHEDYDKRLSQIENKLSLLNLGRNLSK